jgi:hypothetical protein
MVYAFAVVARPRYALDLAPVNLSDASSAVRLIGCLLSQLKNINPLPCLAQTIELQSILRNNKNGNRRREKENTTN